MLYAKNSLQTKSLIFVVMYSCSHLCEVGDFNVNLTTKMNVKLNAI